MRVRTLLFLPVLAATMAGIAAAGASAATLFVTPSHIQRVPAGTAGSFTSTRSLALTTDTGEVANSCAHSNLGLTVDENTHTRVTMTVTSTSFSQCSPFSMTGTTSPAWKITVTGTATVSGTTAIWTATAHNVRLDLPSVGTLSGNLETGITVTQPIPGTAPVCINLASARALGGPLVSTWDGRYCASGASAFWSLTN
jgi:hypothetical protein